MKTLTNRPAMGTLFMIILGFTLGGYFMFAAIQGDFGVFRQVELAAETKALILERDRLAADLNALQNLTRRMSDSYLDLDLLDEQAREVLGYLRADEIVIR